jgi:hypothetical protein
MPKIVGQVPDSQRSFDEADGFATSRGSKMKAVHHRPLLRE